ncbi:MAG: minichromosome maintenance protein MCM [Nanoarchaeota archaeon]|nr:minichromosome maintenance protein MCM [Nanoarchaeota archaeon]
MPDKKTEELVREARNFFETYKKEIGKEIRQGKSVISLEFKDISSFSHELAELLLVKPEDIFQIFEIALEELGLVVNPRIRLMSLGDSYSEKIRNLRAKHLNKLIQIEGIVRQASEVRPQVINAKFECPSCGTIISVLQIESKFREPNRCSCGRKGGFKIISKDMVDAQRLVIEESPESLVGGEQPRRISIFLKEDLVEPRMEERTTPGSKARVIGILKEVPRLSHTGGILTRYDIAVEANNLIPLEETYEEVDINEEDERQIKELAADEKVLDKFIESIAPSVYGYEEIKKALVLQLFGGVKKLRGDGTHSRGDIHVLLVGDPGVAKSVMLKFISTIAPKGRYVVGKSATGAGLTATVVKDEFLKGWSLEAGAMVLSHKGIIAIDELEKMDAQDRSAMHEALEQQSVTISKANVQASLKAETSVLAAANPKFGRFDPYQTVASQIDIPPTLINRFDVIFILKDNPDRAQDEAIATHVLLEHQNLGVKSSIDKDLFKKYIAYSKQIESPKLTSEAVDEIKKFYVELRNTSVSLDQPTKPLPISARQLEALVRMSEANAKCRLGKKVTRKDALVAIELMKYYLMQVGYDYETKTYDIDRIVTGVSTSQRSKIMAVRETLIKLESRLGKLIPIEELKRELKDKISETEIDDCLNKLTTSGDVFHPKRGFVQRT